MVRNAVKPTRAEMSTPPRAAPASLRAGPTGLSRSMTLSSTPDERDEGVDILDRAIGDVAKLGRPDELPLTEPAGCGR